MLDFRRFRNASTLNLFRSEVTALRAAGAEQPVFTNMVFRIMWLDQYEWTHYADYTAIDMYQISHTQAEKLRQFVRGGGTLIVTSYFSDITDLHDHDKG